MLTKEQLEDIVWFLLSEKDQARAKARLAVGEGVSQQQTGRAIAYEDAANTILRAINKATDQSLKLFVWQELPCLYECANGVCFAMAQTKEEAIEIISKSKDSFPGLVEEIKNYAPDVLTGEDAWGWRHGPG